MSTAFTNLQAVPIDAALPAQNTNTNGKALISNGTNCGWNTILAMIGAGPGQTTGDNVAAAVLPPQSGASGKVLSTDGNGTLSWITSASDASGASGITSIIISGTTYTGPSVTISNVPSATTAGNVTGTVAVTNGGTGATSAANALTNLGAAPLNHTHNYAPLNSASLSGVPTAPTAAGGTNTAQLATTAFVSSAIAANPGPRGYTGSAGATGATGTTGAQGPAGNVATASNSVGTTVLDYSTNMGLAYGQTFSGSIIGGGLGGGFGLTGTWQIRGKLMPYWSQDSSNVYTAYLFLRIA